MSGPSPTAGSPITTLALFHQALSPREHGRLPHLVLPVIFVPGLGGAWTELWNGREVIRFGYPQSARSPWFRVLDPSPGDHHCASLALERIVYARRITEVVVAEDVLAPAARRGLRQFPQVELRVFSRREEALNHLALQAPPQDRTP